jgi:hypothetical protein
LAATFALTAVPANAAIILFDYGLNIDSGLLLAGDALPGSVDGSSFDFTTGLGELAVTVTGAGDHSVTAFFDHDIDEALNTFFNEQATTGGVAASDQSWEIDEPGYVSGDIYDNFLVGALDSANALAGLQDDVSMALGFDFTLAAAQTAVVTFFLDTLNNSPGFFLRHFDPDSAADELTQGPNELFFWSTLEIFGDLPPPPPPPTGVPEPSSIWLLAAGLLSLAGVRRRRRG